MQELKFNFFDPLFAGNPAVFYDLLRRSGDAPYSRQLDGHILCTYAAVRQAALSPDVYGMVRRERIGADDPLRERFGNWSLDQTAERHRHSRNLMRQAFSEENSVRIHARIAPYARTLWQEVLRAGGGDFVTAVANPLARRLLAELIGLPEAAVADHLADVQAITAYMGLARTIAGTDKDHSAVTAAYMRLHELCSTTRGSTGGAGWLAGNFQTTGAADVADLGVLLFFAAYATSRLQLSSCFAVLWSHPEQEHVLRAQPQDTLRFIEEVVRLEPALQCIGHRVHADLRFGNTIVPAGANVVSMIGAANRDPAVFAAPNEFRLDRPIKPAHLGFGAGTHYCLGAGVFRLLARLVIEAYLDLVPGAQLHGTGAVYDSVDLSFRGPDALHFAVAN